MSILIVIVFSKIITIYEAFLTTTLVLEGHRANDNKPVTYSALLFRFYIAKVERRVIENLLPKYFIYYKIYINAEYILNYGSILIY